MAVDEKTAAEFKGDRHRGRKYRKDQETKEPKSDQWKYGFPPNVTVDELWLYRKRKPNAVTIKDNLHIEQGSFKFLKSEYRRRFKNFYEALRTIQGEGANNIFAVQPVNQDVPLKWEGARDYQSEYNESFRKRIIEPFQKTIDQQMDNEIATRFISSKENHPSAVKIPAIFHRSLLRRPTTLKIEGDFTHLTEHAEKFIEYLLAKRAQLLRTPTTLKLEGEMETKTETSENYIKYDNLQRPALCKKFTHLHLEGDLDNQTEKREKFVPFEVQKRPPGHLVKKSTNLHLEGDQDLIPEYTREYINFGSQERPKLALPRNNLKAGGIFEAATNGDQFDRTMHPLIPFLRETGVKIVSQEYRKSPTKSSYTFDNKEQQNSLTRVSSHPNLSTSKLPERTSQGRNPKAALEYQNAYLDLEKVPSTPRIRRQTEIDYMKGDGKMETKPEYTSSYVDFPRQRPSLRRPETHFGTEGKVYYVTENEDGFKPHAYLGKTESCKKEPGLKLEGRFECQPEYRKAYIDYLVRERKPPTTQRRIVLEADDMNDKSDTSPTENISSSDAVEINAATSKEPKPRATNIPKESFSPTSSIPSTVKTSKIVSKPPRSTKLLHVGEPAFGQKQARSRRSLTPSPVPRTDLKSPYGRPSRGSTPNLLVREDRRIIPEIREPLPSDSDKWNGSFKRDTAFLVIDDRVPNRRSVRNHLYKQQKWMPSWNYPTQ